MLKHHPFSELSLAFEISPSSARLLTASSMSFCNASKYSLKTPKKAASPGRAITTSTVIIQLRKANVQVTHSEQYRSEGNEAEEAPSVRQSALLYWGYIGVISGIVENKMETTIISWGYIGVILEKPT